MSYMAPNPRSKLFAVALMALVGGCAPNASTTGLPTPRPTQTASPVPLPSCSAVAIPSVTPPPDALITLPPAANTVTVTSADAGATVFLTTLQHLVVEVGFPGPPPRSGSGTSQGTEAFWTIPQAPYPGPLYREGSKTCPGGNSLAVFSAVGTGGTTVGATTDAPYLHTQPACEIAQQGIEIYVVVRPQ